MEKELPCFDCGSFNLYYFLSPVIDHIFDHERDLIHTLIMKIEHFNTLLLLYTGDTKNLNEMSCIRVGPAEFGLINVRSFFTLADNRSLRSFRGVLFCCVYKLTYGPNLLCIEHRESCVKPNVVKINLIE
jgi:hypothetical protein